MLKSKENIMANKKQKRNDTVNPYDIQIGGTHYKKMKIQPSRFVIENKMAFLKEMSLNTFVDILIKVESKTWKKQNIL